MVVATKSLMSSQIFFIRVKSAPDVQEHLGTLGKDCGEEGPGSERVIAANSNIECKK